MWSELNLKCLDPQEWGWKMLKGELVPIKTDLDASPEYLLKIIRCKCKTSSANVCGEKTQCSCQKNGLRCVAACADCHGISCCNVSADRVGIDMEDGGVDTFTDE